MTARRIDAAPAPTGQAVLDRFLPTLRRALDGTGPAIAPLLPAAAGRAADLRYADRLRAAIAPAAPLEHDDVAAIITTSGSTGEPKGALLTADALHASARASLDRLGGPGTWLLALPVHHVAGLQVLVRSLVAGTAPHVVDLGAGFHPAAFAAATAALPAAGRRYTALVPTQLVRLLDAGVDLRPYDAILVGGAAASGDLLRRARAAGARVVTTYGSSETSGGCVYDGRPLDGVDVDVRADGVVTVAGPVLFRGYRLRPDLTATALVDGRYVTGDLGRLDGGRLVVLGRADDVVVTGGENVPAALVEDAVAAHPGVSAVAVVGRADPEWGERVVAVVSAVDPADPPALEDVRDRARATLPAHALPRELVLVDELPLLPSGKVDRLRVRALLASLPG